MVLVAFFLLFFLVTLGIFLWLTQRGIGNKWEKEGPGPITEKLKRRNLPILLITLAFLLLMLATEALVFDFHILLRSLQEDVNFNLGFGNPPGILTLANGSGISWGLYLSVGLGIFLGITLGTFFACKGFPATKRISYLELMFK